MIIGWWSELDMIRVLKDHTMIVRYSLTSCILETLQLRKLPMDIVPSEVPDSLICQLLGMGDVHFK